jgi:hypothetical protein
MTLLALVYESSFTRNKRYILVTAHQQLKLLLYMDSESAAGDLITLHSKKIILLLFR